MATFDFVTNMHLAL